MAESGLVVPLPTAVATRDLGLRLGRALRAGDLVVLTGDLGAGKTTLTQGLAEGLGVRGPVTSPTFVIARVHPSLVGGPDLVHVDAYRLGGAVELDDLDLDADTDASVTVVEWGHGVAERLADEYVEVVLARADSASPRLDDGDDRDDRDDRDDGGDGDGDDEERTATLTAVGARWAGLSSEVGGAVAIRDAGAAAVPERGRRPGD